MIFLLHRSKVSNEPVGGSHKFLSVDINPGKKKWYSCFRWVWSFFSRYVQLRAKCLDLPLHCLLGTVVMKIASNEISVHLQQVGKFQNLFLIFLFVMSQSDCWIISPVIFPVVIDGSCLFQKKY